MQKACQILKTRPRPVLKGPGAGKQSLGTRGQKNTKLALRFVEIVKNVKCGWSERGLIKIWA